MFKITTYIKPLLICAIVLLSSSCVMCQIRAISVKKTIVKEFEVTGKTVLSFQANKADIQFKSTTRKSIIITAVLSAINKEKQIAEEDLSTLTVNLSRSGNIISAVNYVQLAADKSKPKSNLKVNYTVEIPSTSNLAIKVNNDFGKIRSNGIRSRMAIESKYCSIELKNHNGYIKLKDNFGTIKLTAVKGDLQLKLERSNLNLTEQVGELEIKSNFSKIELAKIQLISDAKITDRHSEVTILQPCLNCYSYNFNLEKSSFSFPTGITAEYVTNNETQKVGIIHNVKPSAKIFNITSTSGIITLK